MVQVDTQESRLDSGSGAVAAGEYHWMVEEVEVETNDFGGSLKVVSSVLAGTTAGQVGHKQTEFFQLSGKAVDRLRRLLVATHMMTDDEWKERIGQQLEFDETLLKGRQFCARVKLEKYVGKKEEHQGKLFPKIGFDIWSVWDERAKHIPKDKECIDLLGTPPAGGGSSATQPASDQQKSPKSSPSSAAADSSAKFSW